MQDSPGGNRLATAAPGGSVGTETDAVVVRTSRVDGVAPAEAEANAVQLVNSKEVNEIDRIAIEQESSWSAYLLLLLGAALAAASAVCLLPRLIRPADEVAASARASIDDPRGRAERQSRSAAFEDELSRQPTLRAPALNSCSAHGGSLHPRSHGGLKPDRLDGQAGVGGCAQLVVAGRDAVTGTIVHTFPDVVGQPIEPASAMVADEEWRCSKRRLCVQP